MSIDHVILDFDHTLFDADDFKVALAASLAPFGVKEEAFWGTYRHARDAAEDGYSYSPEKHAALLEARTGVSPKEATAALTSVVARAQDFLYPDAKDFLSRLISLSVPTTILTRGDPAFQKEKIARTGVDKLVHNIVATDKPKQDIVREMLAASQGTLYVVNDHVEETDQLRRLSDRIVPILKRRADQPPERYLHIGMLNFRTLTDIRDYLTIVHATHPQYGD